MHAAKTAVFVLLLSLFGAADNGRAQADPSSGGVPDPGKWEVIVTPYLWGISMTGDITVDGTTVDMDVPFGDIFSNLNYGLIGSVHGRYDRFVYTLDGLGAILSFDDTIFPADIDVDTVLRTAVVAGGYRLYEGTRAGFFRLPQGPEPRRMSLDLLVGARWWSLRNTAGILIPTVTPGRLQLRVNTGWWDPMIRANTRIELSRRFLLMLSGGYGGFGWGEASNSTWDAIGLIGWRFSPRWALLAGYRAVDFDRGSSFNGFSLRLQGPVVGLSYRFGGPEPDSTKE